MVDLDRNVYETQPNTRYGEYIPRQIMLKKNGKKIEVHVIFPLSLPAIFSLSDDFSYKSKRKKKLSAL